MATNEPRVLIIEDHDVLRAMLFTILRHQPLAVDTATSADEALEKIEGCDYALILIDMNLSGGDAERFLQAFPSVRTEWTTLFIAVRDPNKPTYIDPNLVSAVLNKPLELDTLADVVRECAAVVPPPADPHPCPPAESDFARLMERGSEPN